MANVVHIWVYKVLKISSTLDNPNEPVKLIEKWNDVLDVHKTHTNLLKHFSSPHSVNHRDVPYCLASQFYVHSVMTSPLTYCLIWELYLSFKIPLKVIIPEDDNCKVCWTLENPQHPTWPSPESPSPIKIIPFIILAKCIFLSTFVVSVQLF
jgi:hypothetical protein